MTPRIHIEDETHLCARQCTHGALMEGRAMRLEREGHLELWIGVLMGALVGI